MYSGDHPGSSAGPDPRRWKALALLAVADFVVVLDGVRPPLPGELQGCPNAPGLVLSANVFSNASMISELILTLLGPDAMLAQWVVKLGWFTIGNALGFAANVLGVLDS